MVERGVTLMALLSTEGALEFGQFLAVGGGLSAAGEASRALGQGVAGGANTICPVGRRLL